MFMLISFQGPSVLQKSYVKKKMALHHICLATSLKLVLFKTKYGEAPPILATLILVHLKEFELC